MGIAQIPLPSSGITVADGNAAGWGNRGATVAEGNAAGWGNTGGETWTLLNSGGLVGVNTLTFTSISGYKTLKFIWLEGETTNNRHLRLRLNNVTTSTYAFGRFGIQNNGVGTTYDYGQSAINIEYSTVNRHMGQFQIEQANISGVKLVSFQSIGRSTASNYTDSQMMAFGGNANITDPITRLDISLNADSFLTGSYALYGGN